MHDENGVAVPVHLPPPTFIQYYRYSIAETEWSSVKHPERPPYKLGLWGWGIELLALGAFALAGLIGPSCLASFAYCDDCQRFMKTAKSISHPIRAPFPSLKKGDLVGEQTYQEEDTTVIRNTVTYLKNLVALLESAPTSTAVADWLDGNLPTHSYDKKQQTKIPNVMTITLSECPLCDNYQVLIAIGQTPNIPNVKMITAFELLRFHKGTFVTNAVELLEEIGK